MGTCCSARKRKNYDSLSFAEGKNGKVNHIKNLDKKIWFYDNKRGVTKFGCAVYRPADLKTGLSHSCLLLLFN